VAAKRFALADCVAGLGLPIEKEVSACRTRWPRCSHRRGWVRWFDSFDLRFGLAQRLALPSAAEFCRH